MIKREGNRKEIRKWKERHLVAGRKEEERIREREEDTCKTMIKN